MGNPYFIEGPALLSFSSGNTSAMLVERVIAAHGGRLPDDIWICFSNTGKEDERSLIFADQCESYWQHRVWWIEFTLEAPGFRVVTFETASRNGAPFAALIDKKGYVPNRGAPYCSIELKARTIRNFVKHTYQVKRWKSIIGLRRDEELRVLGAIGRNESGKDPWRNVMPMYENGDTKAEVMIAADARPFRLAIEGYQGNCVHCWKKAHYKRVQLIRDAIARDDLSDVMWWAEQEQKTGTTFLPGLSVLDLIERAKNEPLLPFLDELEDDDADCGFTCIISDADQMEIAA